MIWLATCGAHATSLQLTQEEQIWLKEHKTIRISGPQAFPPFQFFDDKGSFSGMASDYIYHIASMVGLQIEVAEKQPWPKILNKIENREIDLLTCAAITEKRSNYLLYTKHHFSFPLIIISRKDAPFIEGLQSLHHKRVAVVRKNAIIEWMHRDKIAFIPHYVNTPVEALREVSLGNADFTIDNLATATYFIEKLGLANLKIAAPTSYENYTLSIAVRKDWPELVSIFDKGLIAMSQDKKDEIRQRVLAVRYEHGIEVKDIATWVALVSGIALLLVLTFYLWNRKLATEIQERKRVQLEKELLIMELTDTIQETNTLRGILPICSECKNIRDDKGYWTQIEDYISKHSDADFSHGICPTCVEKLYGGEKWFRQKAGERK